MGNFSNVFKMVCHPCPSFGRDHLVRFFAARMEWVYEIQRRIPVDALLLTNLRTPYEMGEEWKYLLFSDQSLPLHRNVKFHNGGCS